MTVNQLGYSTFNSCRDFLINPLQYFFFLHWNFGSVKLVRMLYYSADFLLQHLQRYLKHINQINQIHSLLITNGHLIFKPNSNLKWASTLLYNTLIRAHLNLGDSHKSIQLFTFMLVHQSPPNNHTIPSLIKAISSSSTSASLLGRPIHCQSIKRGLCFDPFVHTSFVSFYAQFGDLVEARKVFEEITEPCVVSINSMLDAYGKNGDMESALMLFERMPERDIVSWTSIINGFGRNGWFEEAIRFFGKMMVHEDVTDYIVRPNEATLVSVLSSCANSDGGGALYRGKQIHGYIITNGIEFTVFLGTALISMYGKTGWLRGSVEVFNEMMVKEVCTWNAMISSLACNGQEKEALIMFEKMRMGGFHPNEITFVAVLTACARAKLVELGMRWFKLMLHDFGVVPKMEHYGCIVDLLGRAGLLEEATEFIRSMPFEPDATVLGALLGACKVHGAVELAGDVGRRLLKLQPQHCGRYVVLSNIFAEAGRWGHASELRTSMVESGIRKIAAHSWLEST